MGAFDDIEPGSPRSPPLSPGLPKSPVLGRAMGDTRRKLTLFLLLGGILLMSFVAFRRQDEIGEIIETQKQHYWDLSEDTSEQSNATHSYKGNKKQTSGTLIEVEGAQNGTSKEERKGRKPWGFRKTKGSQKSVEEKSEEEQKQNATKSVVLPGPTFNERHLHDESLLQLRNDTLGFGQVYVLNMPGRTDKLDAFRLASSLTNFSFEILPGISGKDVSSKALPGDFSHYDKNEGGVIGCWRGHMNFASKVIENRLASAIVMEDDADWDVNLRSQLEHIALGSQALLSTPSDSVPVSPYGDGWDLIWLGHCASQPQDGDFRRVLMKNDKTTTPPTHRANWGTKPDMWPRYDNTTRMIYFAKGGTCTYAYAISYHGAAKMLKYMSMDIYQDAVDFGLEDMCKDKKRNFRCIGVFPQIVGDHKPAGGANKDSDIGKGGSKDNVREKGFTYNVVHSTRLNINKLIDGRPLDEAESQWPEDTPDVRGPIQMEWKEEEVPDTHPEGWELEEEEKEKEEEQEDEAEESSS